MQQFYNTFKSPKHSMFGGLQFVLFLTAQMNNTPEARFFDKEAFY